MDVYTDEVGRKGAGLYPRQVACLNHSNTPNCVTLFEGGSYQVRVRTIAPIARGEELCISYVDQGKSWAAVRAEIRRKYHFDCGAVDERYQA
eukprot:5222318-Prymnesium_polylepis.1